MNNAKLLLLCFLIPSAIAIQKKNKPDFSKYPLPNCVQIDDNLYADRYEITNFNWLEYLHWNKKIFGADYPEYLAALPDTNVWLNMETPSSFLAKHYLRSPIFRDYPVVGVSQQQARDCAIWRSDRVFEIYLIKTKTIREEKAQNANNYFTIQRYFKNQLDYAPRNTSIDYYPEFRLPNSIERKKMLSHSQEHGKTIKNQHITNQHITGQIACDTCRVSPTVPVGNSKNKKSLWLYQLLGNVSEWLEEPNSIAGHSWLGDAQENQNDTHKTNELTSSQIGFRCVASWKKWED